MSVMIKFARIALFLENGRDVRLQTVQVLNKGRPKRLESEVHACCTKAGQRANERKARRYLYRRGNGVVKFNLLQTSKDIFS